MYVSIEISRAEYFSSLVPSNKWGMGASEGFGLGEHDHLFQVTNRYLEINLRE